jgi:DNA polymerase-3 subunit epsilon
MDKPGYIDGRHYTTYCDEVRLLKRSGQFDQAERLLIRLVDATEEEARANGRGVAPWYYHQLAMTYARLKQPKAELAILERYERQPKSPGARPAKLAARLARLRQRMAH